MNFKFSFWVKFQTYGHPMALNTHLSMRGDRLTFRVLFIAYLIFFVLLRRFIFVSVVLVLISDNDCGVIK